MKELVFEIRVNDKYIFYVTADTHEEAKEEGKKFYLENNYFTDKEIRSVSTKVRISKKDIVNYKN